MHGTCIIARQEQRVEPCLSRNVCARLNPLHHQCRCPSIRRGKGRRDHGDGCGRGKKWRTARGVHRVGEITLLDRDPVTIVARGRHRCILKRQNGMRRASVTLLETNLDLLEQSAQDLLQRETLDEPDLVAIGSKVNRTEAVAA